MNRTDRPLRSPRGSLPRKQSPSPHGARSTRWDHSRIRWHLLVTCFLLTTLSVVYFLSHHFSRSLRHDSNIRENEWEYPTTGSHPISGESWENNSFDLRQHTLEELFELPSENQLSSRVSIVAIIQFNKEFEQTIGSIFEQSIKPTAILVGCTVAQERDARIAINTLISVHESIPIHLHVVGDLPHSWVQLSSLKSTEYVLLLTEPLSTTQTLEALFYVAGTQPYRQTVIGTQGAVLPSRRAQNTQIKCLPQSTTFPADILEGAWILRRSWIPLLLGEQFWQLSSDFPLGFILSYSFAYHGIPSYALPQLAGGGKSRCRQLQNQFENHRLWKDMVFTGIPRPSERLEMEQDGIVIAVHGPRQLASLRALICRFRSSNRVIHVISDTSPMEFGCEGVLVYSLMHDLADLSVGVQHVMDLVRPRVVLHVEDRSSNMLAMVSGAARRIGAIEISMPDNHFDHALWIADLPVNVLEKWHTVRIQIVVITNNRPHSLSRLLRSISSAYYLGDAVDLTINMERSADRVTTLLVNTFMWNHGPKHLRHRIRQGGLMPAIVESWYPSDNHDHAVLLEDDIEVSPLFYTWSKMNILKYRYGSTKAQRLYGLSLYGPRHIELFADGRHRWHPDSSLTGTGFPLRTPYLSQIPCSWGAVYFPEQWREFHYYLTARIEDVYGKKLQTITVPGARSNKWTKSWKKYFIELVYLRGYVMLYPNFADLKAFSTNHLEFGTHIRTNRDKADEFAVPLMQQDLILEELPGGKAPEWENLPVLDLWGKVLPFEELIRRGHQLHKEVSACPVPTDDNLIFDPSDLLCPFVEDHATIS
ncbi:uncharacterized protein VTP21DRAFT_1814 [Calcarisporiella thermophila]|uniref:uncharacterized protein n=1 Tax=Calcarisporiella thermophila TaxID=911321 RepID=UPI003744A62F